MWSNSELRAAAAAGKRQSFINNGRGGPVWRGVRSNRRVCGTANRMGGTGGSRAARRRVAAAARLAGVRPRLAGCSPARGAARAAYKVDIEASPRAVRKLLEEHLDIARFAKRDDISDDQFGFLVTATPQQVRDLTATAGYFSPVVRTDVRTVDGKKARHRERRSRSANHHFVHFAVVSTGRC